MKRLVVSIEQNDCTSCGVCPEYSADHFYMDDDNYAHVKEAGALDPTNPEICGFMGKVLVKQGLEDDVIDAADACPGSCIYVEEAVSEAAA